MITNYKIFENRINIGKRMNLSKDILDIYNIFKTNNKDLLVCGGAVRDFINNQSPHDIDLVTNAKPDEIIEMLEDQYRLDLQGKQFGVVRVYTKETPLGIEIATYRKDLVKGRDNKGDNKKVDVDTATINSDAERRDIKINAMYYNIETGEIVDLVGGLNDLEQNIISAVGEPSQRFDEDRLRLLRVIRFASRNLSEIDKKTSDAIMNDRRLRNISDIDDVSQERIFEEFKKAIDWCRDHNKTNSLMFYLTLLKKYHLFEEMFPDVKINIEGIYTFDLAIIFALLFRDNNPNRELEDKLAEFKISNSTKEPKKILDRTMFLIQARNNIENIEKIPELNKKRKQIDIDNITIKKFFDIEYKSPNQRKYVNCFLKYNPKISGRELISQGIKGIEIGNEIRRREIEEFQNLLDNYNDDDNFLE